MLLKYIFGDIFKTVTDRTRSLERYRVFEKGDILVNTSRVRERK